MKLRELVALHWRDLPRRHLHEQLMRFYFGHMDDLS
jgi:hypothetical protein